MVSTDPAHSLGDVLGGRLGARPRRLRLHAGHAAAGHLDAVELDADAALTRWLRTRRRALRAIAERGTYLDEDDIERLLRLSLPGVDELIGLVELRRLAAAAPCDDVVVDTAPTGHTLRLLAMPETLGRFAAVLDGMQAKHRFLAASLGGGYRADASDVLIAEIDGHARELAALLRDAGRARFTWILLPEALSLAEARDGIAALDAAGMAVREVVVNRVSPAEADCAWCAERVRAEGAVIAAARAAFRARPLRLVPAVDVEPVGIPALRQFARALTVGPGRAAGRRPALKRRALQRRDAPRAPTTRGTRDDVPLDVVAPVGARLVIVVGKGGVGKTTCAAAIAMVLARQRPRARVLLMSADPAHSVADVLDAPVGDDARAVAGAAPGLRAREMDAARALAERQARYRDGVAALFRAVQGDSRFEPTFDREVMEDLIELAPPGIDELFATLSIIDALLTARAGEAAYDTVVLDTAPTGHALRLLALPDTALRWVHALMTILLKYRAVTGLGRLASDLVDLSRNLRALQALLRDGARTRAVVVTRAAAVPAAETARLLAALRRRRIAVSAIVVNALAPPSCARRRREAASQARALAVLARRARRGRGARPVLLGAPAAATPPRGPVALERWLASWQPLRG